MRRTLPTTRRCYLRLASRLLVAALLASAISAVRPGLAQDAKSEGRSELMLQKLPPRGSKAYNDLLGRAGKTANGQVLGFTQSEMWSMPTSRIEDVIRQGEALGVKMTRLGTDWNQVLKRPSAPMAMSPSQEAMMQAMKGSKETMGVGTSVSKSRTAMPLPANTSATRSAKCSERKRRS